MKNKNLNWLDLTNPTEEELAALATEHSLPQEAVQDCLQPDHLPKFEEIDKHKFIVSRIYDASQTSDADTIQEVSRKISIFVTPTHLITVHRSEQPFLADLRAHESQHQRCDDVQELVMLILNKVVLSYDAPAEKLAEEIDYLEERIFLRSKLPKLLRSLYRIKRKISVIRRIITLSRDIVNKMELEKKRDPLFRELYDNFVRQETIYDQLTDHINNLMALYLSINAQRNNDVMRVLTVFSVFFMPLTFIVGVYGMNFKNMPELNWHYGYYTSILFMVLVTVVIYFWFRRKGWF
jgi:magnesium transporter